MCKHVLDGNRRAAWAVRRTFGRHVGLNGTQDSGVDGVASRLWYCPAYRTNEWLSSVVELWDFYPALLKLEQEVAIVSEWGVSENN